MLLTTLVPLLSLLPLFSAVPAPQSQTIVNQAFTSSNSTSGHTLSHAQLLSRASIQNSGQAALPVVREAHAQTRRAHVGAQVKRNTLRMKRDLSGNRKMVRTVVKRGSSAQCLASTSLTGATTTATTSTSTASSSRSSPTASSSSSSSASASAAASTSSSSASGVGLLNPTVPLQSLPPVVGAQQSSTSSLPASSSSSSLAGSASSGTYSVTASSSRISSATSDRYSTSIAPPRESSSSPSSAPASSSRVSSAASDLYSSSIASARPSSSSPASTTIASTATSSSISSSTTTSSAVPSSSTSSSTIPSSTSSSTPAASSSTSLIVDDPSGTDGPFSGWGTWFDDGLGACGWYNVPADPIVAVSAELFDNWPGYSGWNPNNNPICGLHLNITWGGKWAIAEVADRCPGCAVRSLDFSVGLFEHFATLDVGLLGMDSYTGNISWSWVEGTGALAQLPVS